MSISNAIITAFIILQQITFAAEFNMQLRPREYSILELPGGGAANLTTIKVLEQLELDTGKRIYQLFDLIVGASMGSYIAALLTVPEPGENLPMSATHIRELLENEVFGSYFSYGPKAIGYAKALNVFFSLECRINPEMQLLKDSTLKPLIILAAEVNSWTKFGLVESTTHVCFSNADEPDESTDSCAINLCDAVAASCNILGLHYVGTQNIRGLDNNRCFMDSGLRGKMTVSSCDLFDVDKIKKLATNSGRTSIAHYFIGNGWVQSPSHSSQLFDLLYDINFDLAPAFNEWEENSYLGKALSKICPRNPNLIGSGFMPKELLFDIADKKLAEKAGEYVRLKQAIIAAKLEQ